jgi:flagellar motility protein MotE (MotC chaperone)
MSKLTDLIQADLSPIDREQLFREMIDEHYSLETVGGPFAHMQASRVLEEMDPTAFRCGVNDYCDSLGLYEVGGESYDGDKCEEIRDALIDELDNQIQDLETELEALDDEDLGEAPGLRRKIADLEAERKEIKSEAL